MKRLFVLGLLALGFTSVQAQFTSNAPWSGNTAPQTLPRKKTTDQDGGVPQNVPFDGGIGVLLVAGALYGKRVHNRQKAAQAL